MESFYNLYNNIYDYVYMKPGDWKCGCGEINFKSRNSCRKCNKNKARPSDWNCQCGELNFANRTSCRKCGNVKDELINQMPVVQNSIVAMKPGDWICPNDLCKEHNFKVRDICRKCNTSKNPQPKEVNDESDDDDNTCIICLDKPRAYAITKCGHLCYCDTCGLNINKCPICREVYNPTTDLLKIFNI